MTRSAALWILLILSLGVIVYVSSERKKISQKKQVPLVIESQADFSPEESQVAAASTSPAENNFLLRVISEPEGAEVFVEGQLIGRAPVELPVPAESRKLRLVLEAFENYERQIPAAKDAEGDLIWKIQLKKAQGPAPLGEEVFYSKSFGPFSIQLKAVALAEFNAAVVEEFKEYSFCRVLVNEQVWVRVLKGPYKTRAQAQQGLPKIKNQYADAFVATSHPCLSK
jgi:hypothetical protein